ncbi:MAG: hypothetical protein R2762_23405 [Bryobacteraceae bacterium]
MLRRKANSLKTSGAALACVALFTAPAALARDQWIRATSPHFELYTPAGAGAARSAIQHFEQVRGFFVNTMGLEPKETKRVRIVGFKSEKEFRRFDKYQWAAAFYQPGVDRDYIVMKSLGDSLYSVAIHEYVHLLARRLEMKLPIWLGEGMAEFYSTLRPIGGKIRVGEFEPSRFQVLMRNTWLPLADLTGAGRESAYRDESNRISIFYAQSWALAHMVMMEDDYRPKSAQFVRAVQTTPAAEVFEKLYGKSLAAVDRDLQGYMRGNSYRVIHVDAKLEKLAESPDIAPISSSEADLILARVLTNSGQFEEALTLAEPLASDAANAEAHEVLAYIHLYGNRDERALAHFEKAVAAQSASAPLYRDYANLLMRSNRNADAVKALQKNLELEPGDVDTRLTLGSLLLSQQRYGEALSELAQAKRVPPAKASRLYRMLAHSYLRLKAEGEARKSARMARKYAVEETDVLESDRLLAYLDRLDAYASQAARRNQAGRAGVERPAAPPQSSAEEEPPALADLTDQAPPTLRRRPLTAEDVAGDGLLEVVPSTQLAEIEGIFEALECRPEGARVHLRTAAGPLVLAIDDPALVAIRGKNADSIELQCGPQSGNPPVGAGYLPQGAPEGAAGLLRRLEYR